MERYFMCHLLYPVLLLLVLLFCCVGTSFAAVVHHLPQKGESAWHAYTVANTEKSGENWKPIRIKVSAEDVDAALSRCKGRWVWARWRGTPSRDKENEGLCGNTTGITDAKKDLLLNTLLPAAIKLHTDRLRIERKRGEVGVSASTISSVTSECNDRIAKLRKKKKDFPKADFVLFVGLATSRTPTRVCSEEENKRPTSALIKFVPKDIVETRHFVRTAAHEIAHGLGFLWNRMGSLKMIRYGTVESNGNARAVNSDIMKEKVREHYGCEVSLVAGMYMEDEGDAHDKSHWERRIAKDELMSPYTGEPSGMYYTAITLAAFHSMPFYSANFAMAEPMSWGNQSGCNLLLRTCRRSKDDLMKRNSMFCSEGKPVLQCTSDRFALGMCSSITVSEGLSQEYHYFERVSSAQKDDMMNDCPIIKPFKETTCESGNVKLMPGSIVGKMSRCLDVKGPEFNEGNKENVVSVQGICAKVKCEGGKLHVQYKGDADNVWHTCENENKEIELRGGVFNGGSIVCPKYKEVCTGLPETGEVTLAEEEEEEAVNTKGDVKGNKDTLAGPEGGSVMRSDINVRSERLPVSEESDGVSSQASIVNEDDESNPASSVVDGDSTGRRGAGVEKGKLSNPVRGAVVDSKGKKDAEIEKSKLSKKVSGSREQSPGTPRSDQGEDVLLPPSEVPGNSDTTPSEKGHTSADVRRTQPTRMRVFPAFRRVSLVGRVLTRVSRHRILPHLHYLSLFLLWWCFHEPHIRPQKTDKELCLLHSLKSYCIWRTELINVFFPSFKGRHLMERYSRNS